jgi:uncharacterized membrane protein
MKDIYIDILISVFIIVIILLIGIYGTGWYYDKQIEKYQLEIVRLEQTIKGHEEQDRQDKYSPGIRAYKQYDEE